MLVFDVGANIGDRTDLFLACGATVLAIEPQPDCTTVLRERFPAPSPVTIEEKAVSDVSGMVELSICNMNEVSTLSEKFIAYYKRYDYLEWKKTITVEAVTLDDLVEEYGLPGYCKIDVEGWELKVLAGLSKSIQTIEFEFNAPFMEDAVAAVQRLHELDARYVFNYSAFEEFTFREPGWLPHDAFTAKLKAMSPGILTGDVYATLG
jgi:FkbM family methyltransferase